MHPLRGFPSSVELSTIVDWDSTIVDWDSTIVENERLCPVRVIGSSSLQI